MTHTLTLPNWLPVSVNVLLAAHWAQRRRLKKADAQLIELYALAQGVPKATGKRRVSVVVTCGPRGRLRDADNSLKVLLDGLVHAGLLRDDGPGWCELGLVEVRRGKVKGTVVVLEDVDA